MPSRLVLEGVTKRFPDVVANDNVTLSVERGEIHALLGENGAGKTTLMEVVYGLYQPEEGRVFVDGVEQRIHSPRDAMKLGIGMVHQHFTLVPILTVVENIALEFVGGGRRRGPLAEIATRVQELARNYGIEVDPWARVEELSVGELQRVEILKALYRDVEILILDEPTALLTPTESEQLFGVMRSLAQEGRSLVFISHKLAEVLAIADRITVLRNGRVVQTLDREDASAEVLTRLMVGDKVMGGRRDAPRRTENPEVSLLEILGVSVVVNDRPVLSELNLQLAAGEIVGIAGVEGNGQREFTELLVGLRRPTTGSVLLKGAETSQMSHAEVTQQGLGFIPADRQGEGLVMGMSIEENLVLRRHHRRRFETLGFMRHSATRRMAEALIQDFGIAASSSRMRVGQLSGGNQQKVVVARELQGSPEVLIAAQPTRGLDIGAEDFVHRLIREHRDRGAGIVLISTNLDEILALSDRALVLYEGRLVGQEASGDLDRYRIGMLMAGRSPDTAETAGRPT